MLKAPLLSSRFPLAERPWILQVYDRDGFLVATCMRGDMYIRDPMNTPGHGTEVSQAVWHPTSKDVSSLLLLLSTGTPFAHMHRVSRAALHDMRD